MSGRVENKPSWLKSLRGEFPESSLLSAEEWRLLVKVRSEIEKESEVSSIESSVDDKRMSKELPLIKNKLEKLIYQMKQYSESVQHFKTFYPRWQLVRQKNIDALLEIAESIQSDKEECNKSVADGSVVSLIGGGILFALKRIPVVALIGGIMTVYGTLAAIGASANETKLLKEKFTKAKATVREDRECFDEIWKCLVDSSKLTEYMDQILNIAIMRKMTEKIKEFHFEIITKRSETQEEMAIKKLLSSLAQFLPCSQKKELSDVVTMVMSFTFFCKRNKSQFEMALHAQNVKSQLDTLAKCLVEGLALSSKFQSLVKNPMKISKCVIVLGMLLDAIVIANISEEIEKGSLSKESKIIKRAANVLKEEAAIVREIYLSILE